MISVANLTHNIPFYRHNSTPSTSLPLASPPSPNNSDIERDAFFHRPKSHPTGAELASRQVVLNGWDSFRQSPSDGRDSGMRGRFDHEGGEDEDHMGSELIIDEGPRTEEKISQRYREERLSQEEYRRERISQEEYRRERISQEEYRKERISQEEYRKERISQDENNESRMREELKNLPSIVEPRVQSWRQSPVQTRDHHAAASPAQRSASSLSPHHEESTRIDTDVPSSEPSFTKERLEERARYFVTPKKARWNLHQGSEVTSPSRTLDEQRPSGSPLSDTIAEETSETFFPSPRREEFKGQDGECYGSEEDEHHGREEEDNFITRTSIYESIPEFTSSRSDSLLRTSETLLAPGAGYGFRGVEDLMEFSVGDLARFGATGERCNQSVRVGQEVPWTGADVGGPTREDVSVDVSKNILSCHLCSFVGEDEQSFSSHMKSTHFKNQCPYCGYCSRTIGRLRRHVTDFHSAKSPGGGATGAGVGGATEGRKQKLRQRRHKCRECDFVSQDQNEYWHHIRAHIPPEKQLLCPHCPFVTACKHHMEYHLRNHLGSKPFKCNSCNYQCINKAMLKSHMKSHSNVYPYRCADCAYAAKYVHALNMHVQKTGHNVWMDGTGPAAATRDNKFGRSLGRMRGGGERLGGRREGVVKSERYEEEKYSGDLAPQSGMTLGKEQLGGGHQVKFNGELALNYAAMNQQQYPSYEQNQVTGYHVTQNEQRRSMHVEEAASSVTESQQYYRNGFMDENSQNYESRRVSADIVSSSSNTPNDSNGRYYTTAVRNSSQSQYIENRNQSGLSDVSFSKTIPSMTSFTHANRFPYVPLDTAQFHKAVQETIQSIKREEEEDVSPGSDMLHHQDQRRRSPMNGFAGQRPNLDVQEANEEDLPPPDLVQFPLDLSSKPKYNDILKEFYLRKDLSYLQGAAAAAAESLKRKRSNEDGDDVGRRQRARTVDWPVAFRALSEREQSEAPAQVLEVNSGAMYDENSEIRPRAGSFPSSHAKATWSVAAQERELRRRRFFQANSELGKIKQQLIGWHELNNGYNDLNEHSRIEPGRSVDVSHWSNDAQTSQSTNQNVSHNYTFTAQNHTANLNYKPEAEARYQTNSDQQIRESETDGLEAGMSSKEGSSDETMQECPHCRIIFPDYVLYTLHMGYHSHTDPFRCNKCGHETSNHRDFFLHIARVAHE